MILNNIESDFLRYLVIHGCEPGTRLPSLSKISAEIGISVGKLREQLEVARVLGLIEASPRRGISCREYSFQPAVNLGLMMALAMKPGQFTAFGVLRAHLESSFWNEAVVLLQDEDKAYLQDLVRQAKAKLNQDRIQIPHQEHRDLHLTIYRRLDNPFVTGLLAAYWDAYEAVELNTYADYPYLQAVWDYHERIVEALCRGDNEEGKALLIQHMNLLDKRGVSLEGLTSPLGKLV
jgi:DNA-binding FadR family transcriptional regulator